MATQSYPFKATSGLPNPSDDDHLSQIKTSRASTALSLSGLSLTQRAAVYNQAFHRGIEWLLAQTRPDGSIGENDGTVFYYRVGWSLALAGRITEAHTHLEWVAAHALPNYGETGALTGGPGETESTGSYPLSCIAMAASLLHRDDIAAECCKQLLQWQHPKSGGFVNNRGNSAMSEEEVLMSTAQGGMSLLQLGRLDDAIKVGEWHAKVWDTQPDIATRLYHTWSEALEPPGLRTELMLGEEQPELYCLKNEVWQWHFDGGIAAAFLGKLYLATQDNRWLKLAIKYMDFTMEGDAQIWASNQLCKASWGAGVLYLCTKEQRYLDWVLQMGDWYLSKQEDDGHWEQSLRATGLLALPGCPYPDATGLNGNIGNRCYQLPLCTGTIDSCLMPAPQFERRSSRTGLRACACSQSATCIRTPACQII